MLLNDNFYENIEQYHLKDIKTNWKPRITFINPPSLITTFGRNWKVHNYFSLFIKLYNPNFLLTDKRQWYGLIPYCLKTQTNILSLKINNLKNYLSNTDILIYPWGMPQSEEKINKIENIFCKFNGMKIFHIMDPQFRASECNAFMEKVGIDYVMGYSRHDQNSDFFQKIFPKFCGKVIDIPFGFDDAWKVQVPFEKRMDKSIGAGAIEPLNWVKTTNYGQQIQDYLFFFSNRYNAMHELRYRIQMNAQEFSNFVDCRFRDKSKSNYIFIKDIVALFNKYKLFINDESLLNFPPIRTFEGCAVGCVMVCGASNCYLDYGFKDNINCIMFKKYNLKEMIEKIRYYLIENPSQLLMIQKESTAFVRKYFNHNNIAHLMYKKLVNAYEKADSV